MLADKWIYGLLIVIGGFLLNLWINFHNITLLAESHPPKTHLGIAHQTQDDFSYYSPAFNWVKHQQWVVGKLDPINPALRYQRPIGYSLFLSAYVMVFNQQSPSLSKLFLYAIVLTQCLLQALVALFIFLVLCTYFSVKKAGTIALFFGIFPLFNGFSFYILTEGITPFLITLILFCTHQIYYKKHRTLYAIVLASSIGITLISRPFLGVFILCLFIPLSYFYQQKKYLLICLVLGITFSPLIIRQTYIRLKYQAEFFNFHAIYHPANASLYRLPHQSLYQWVKNFNSNGQAFHEWHRTLLSTQQPNKTLLLALFDEKSKQLVGENQLEILMRNYHSYLTQIPKFAAKGQYSDLELFLSKTFVQHSKKYQKTYPFKSFVLEPLKVVKALTFHSNLNLSCYQHHYRGKIWMEILRYISLILHLSLFTLPFIHFCISKFSKLDAVLLLIISLSLSYLIFIQRGIEERYTYPFLPILFYLSVKYLPCSCQKLHKIIHLRSFSIKQ